MLFVWHYRRYFVPLYATTAPFSIDIVQRLGRTQYIKSIYFMNLAAKYAYIIILLSSATATLAQSIITPTQLSASYKKYPNRIDLTWQATGANHTYIIQRRTRASKSFVQIDTVAQNRYVDRNKLTTNTDYLYRVQSVDANGAASAPSKEAVGALLIMADGKNPVQKDSILLENCMKLTITDAKVTTAFFVLKFLMSSSCNLPKSAQLSLYHSADEVLDDADAFLVRQSFQTSRSRGSMTAKNVAGVTEGYLLLHVEANGGGFTVGQRIK
jgi:hypothetical protein